MSKNHQPVISFLQADEAKNIINDMLAPLCAELRSAADTKQEANTPPLYVSRRTAARMLEVSERQIANFAQSGLLNRYAPPTVGGNVRYSVRELEDLYKPIGKVVNTPYRKLKPFKKQEAAQTRTSGKEI